jgi:hypothetical protein
MSTNRSVASAIAVIAGLIGVGPAVAHHSTAAFDTTQVIKIEGTIKQFRWINPHASIKIDGGGTVGLWTIEMTAANALINEGWTRDALQIGDKVTIYANPLRNAITLNDGSAGGLYVGVVLANGSTLGRTDGKGASPSN